jgi:hypothetical protein
MPKQISAFSDWQLSSMHRNGRDGPWAQQPLKSDWVGLPPEQRD